VDRKYRLKPICFHQYAPTHEHVDSIAGIDLDSGVLNRQHDLALKFDPSTAQFTRQAKPDTQIPAKPGPKARCTFTMASTTTVAIRSISSLDFSIILYSEAQRTQSFNPSRSRELCGR